MRKGFTITELLVAMGLLVAVLTASGLVFSYAIEAHRAASATAEIMRTLRAITDQFNADFAGLYPEAPILPGVDPNGNIGPCRADSISFFATGDYQTTNLYNDEIVYGNTARIYYGQSSTPDHSAIDTESRREKILTRRQTILVANAAALPESVEYDSNSVLDAIRLANNDFNAAKALWLARPDIDDISDGNDIAMYLASGIDDFTVQLGDFNDIDQQLHWYPQAADFPDPFAPGKYDKSPSAIKFIFTIYDSKGIIKDGRRFEHIVYIGR